MKNGTRDEPKVEAGDKTAALQRKFDDALQNIEAIQRRLDDLELELKNDDGLPQRWLRRLSDLLNEQAKAHSLALLLTAVGGIATARLLRYLRGSPWRADISKR